MPNTKPDYRRLPGDPDRFDGMVIERFTTESLTRDERKQMDAMIEYSHALFLKSWLYDKDPEKYPLPDDPSSPEVQVHEKVKSLRDDSPFYTLLDEKLTSKFINDPSYKPKNILRPRFKRRNLIDYRNNNIAFDPRIITFQPSANIPVLPIPETPPPPPPPPPPDPVYTSLDLVLETLLCIDETDWEGGSDNMFFSGMKVEANGGTGPLPSFDCGDYNDEDRSTILHHFGEYPLARYDLTNTTGYPKTVYAIFILIESDQSARDTIKSLEKAMNIGTAIVGFISAGVGVLVGTIVGLVAGILEDLFDDDYFPPYGIRLTLSGPNHFNSNVSPTQTTGNMDGQGGTYRIGFKWILNA